MLLLFVTLRLVKSRTLLPTLVYTSLLLDGGVMRVPSVTFDPGVYIGPLSAKPYAAG